MFVLNNCYMTPKILKQILDGIWEFFEAHPVEEQKEEQKAPTYEFSQSNSKKFLDNDETREILYNFLKKVGATDRVIYLNCCGDSEGPMYEWQRDTDGSILIVYLKNGKPIEFVGEADRAK